MWDKPRGSKPGLPVTAAVSSNTLHQGQRVYCETWQQPLREEVSRFVDSKDARITYRLSLGSQARVTPMHRHLRMVSGHKNRTFLSGSIVQFRQWLTTLDRALSVSFKSAEVCDGF